MPSLHTARLGRGQAWVEVRQARGLKSPEFLFLLGRGAVLGGVGWHATPGYWGEGGTRLNVPGYEGVPVHYGLTGGWVQKFKGSYLLRFLHSALVFKARGQCDHHAFPLA